MFAAAAGDLVDGFYAHVPSCMLALMACRLRASPRALRPRGEEDDGPRRGAARHRPLPRPGGCSATCAVTVAGHRSSSCWPRRARARRRLRPGDRRRRRGAAAHRGRRCRTPPPVLVLAALARLLYGLAPRLAALAWLGLVLRRRRADASASCCGSPTGCSDLSPFEHLALVPGRGLRAGAPFAGRRAASPRCSALRGAGWRFTQARRRLASAPCGSPSPVGSDCPAAPARRRSACGARSRAAAPVVVKRLAAPEPPTTRPSSADPRARRLLAARAADVALAGRRRRHRRPAGGRRSCGRGGRRGHHDRAASGSTDDAPAAGCSSRTASAGSPAPTWATGRGWPATSCATGSRASSGAAAGAPWPARRSPTSPTTCGARRESMLERGRRAAAGRPARRPGARPTCPAATATTSSPSTGRTLGHGPGRRRPRATSSLSAREEFEPLLEAYLMGLPDGLATADAGARSAPG